MSRSRRKPYYTDQQTNTPGVSSKAKRSANRVVRAACKKACALDYYKHTPTSGKAYRKEFNSLDIRDWSFHCPKDKKAYRK